VLATAEQPFPVEIAGNAVVERDFVLDDGGTITGVVVDTEGRPLAGMYVVARSPAQRAGPRAGDCKSDVQGAFACNSVAPGEYRVVAQRQPFGARFLLGDGSAGQALTVRANQASSVKLVVEAHGSIRGTVLDGDGKPIADAFVVAARETSGMAVAETRWTWGMRPNVTSADGTFELTGLASDKHTVRAYRKGGGEAIAEHVEVGATVTLQIARGASIEGTARYEGKPVAFLTVSIRDRKTGFSREEAFHEAEGRYAIRDLPRGRFQVTIEAERTRKQVEVDLADGESKTVDVELEDLVTLTGRVVEKGTTTPVAGVQMLANPLGGTMRPRLDENNVSDAQGRFTIRNVSRGKLSIFGVPFAERDRRGLVKVERTIDGTGTIDLGDLELERVGK
jgi:hypothetical protein